MITRRSPRRKKWEHLKLRLRIFLFRFSVLLNGIASLYLLEQSGQLTTVYEMCKDKIAPVLESLIKLLPL